MVYSFLNVQAAIAGPALVANLGAGAAVAEEGISIEASEDKNTQVIGADGNGQNTLVASDAGTVVFRFLKTAPINALLMAAYDYQSSSSSRWGQNIITVNDTARNDYTVAQSCAFKKKPTIVYDKAGPMLEWTFDSIKITTILGQGG